ncbi:gamma-parvin [Denticeps clupeoides]|uniref:Calponin-homology (CH) domain-containing protein n=1 Tax=Denticeps clupeoides TaxID=299321 RepID=A0AAY4DWH1_9TELE|nr:gamma-parvin [Denticeps clupeoides]XP_028815224.1 gamma-parvin [Denticeps clupeoides]XP_028815226.1 gamma-parvin [Denticeps clupeoides]XP_028815227.1 gamma-parvin [Denticeps clupeoides]XP_028815228.1 gamma-parvin [Denticeps clupeoides]
MEASVDQWDEGGFQGERRKVIQPASLKDPKLKSLKEVLVDWINATLKQEHIVVLSLEEDLYDGLVLHHLLGRLALVHLPVEEIALTSAAQVRKLEVVLESLNQRLGVDEETAKWSVSLIHGKDLLATLHLLVAMVKMFQPDLDLPRNVSVEVVWLEVNRSGIKSEKEIEPITDNASGLPGSSSEKMDAIEELLQLEPQKISAFKQAILHFVNKNVASLGLQVTELDKQFADGVILLLLIGQLEGFYIPLYEFVLAPTSSSEMLRNVTLALDILGDREVPLEDVAAEAIVSQDMKATLRVLYALFKKHKSK